MKPQFISSALCACMAFLIVSCDKTPPASSPPPQQPPRQQESKPITVKGFYIGMSAAEVFKTIKDISGLEGAEYWDDIGNKNGDKSKVNNIETFPLPGTRKSLMRFYMEHTADGKLTSFTWGGDAVDFLFNSGNLNAEEFAQQFANAYHIPEFTRRKSPSGDWQWAYKSPDNISITIFDDKNLIIEKDSSEQDIKKNFN